MNLFGRFGKICSAASWLLLLATPTWAAPARTVLSGAKPAAFLTSSAGTSRSLIDPHKRRDKPRAKAISVLLKSASDRSIRSKKNRKRVNQANQARTLFEAEFSRPGDVSLSTDKNQPYYGIDLAITKMQRRTSGTFTEVECEIRVTVSTDSGKMLSFLTGGAKVSVPARTFKATYEPALQAEALENAVKSIHQGLVRYLAREPG